MQSYGVFLLNSVLLGVGLAMDAFSVSLANGLNEPEMSRKKHVGIASCYAWFQFVMPMVGWICVHTIVEAFRSFQKFIPWIALILLLYIGIKMVMEGSRPRKEERDIRKLERKDLLLQGVATSIDALSVGFTTAAYPPGDALVSSLVIAAVTMVLCLAGVEIGRKFGMKFAGKATVAGGVILIAIGLEIFIRGIK